MIRLISTRTWKFILAFGAVYLIWGSTYLAIKVAIETIPPFLMLAARFGLAGFILYAYLRLSGLPRPTREEWISSAVVGSLMLGLGTGALAWAEQFISSGLAALLVSSAPIWMVLLDWLWLKNDRPTAPTLIGMVIAIIGVVLLFKPSGSDTEGLMALIAAGVVTLGAITWSVGSLSSRGAKLPKNPFLAGSMQMLSGGALLAVVSVFTGELSGFDPGLISPASFLGWAYLFLVGSFIPFNAYIWLMRNTSPARVSTYAFVNPIVAVALGWGLLGESITLEMTVAIILMIIGVVLITQFGKGRSQKGRTRSLTLYELDADDHIVECGVLDPGAERKARGLSSSVI